MNRSTVAGGVSELYEAYPYPDHGVVSRVGAEMLRESIGERWLATGRRCLRLVDAGCGTGEQTLGVKRAFPELEVSGFDINPASISRAQQLGRDQGLDVAFCEHDILADPPATAYDVVVAIGVLHHLPDPAGALRQLARCAEPGAVLLGMVYGTYGKADVFAKRDALDLLSGQEADRAQRLEVLDQIRTGRPEALLSQAAQAVRRLRLGPAIPLREAGRRLLAGRNAAWKADTYTHVQELTFTWPELTRMLTATGWTWLGWPRRCGLPDDPAQIFTGTALDKARALDTLQLAQVYERLLRPHNLYFLAQRA